MAKDIQVQTERLIFLPIKHFSPAACAMVEKYLADADYDTLFVEVPQQAKKYLGAMISEKTVTPVSLMFGDGEFAFLPIVDYSPEYAAIKAAASSGKNIVFIDDACFFDRKEFRGNDDFVNASAILESAVEMDYDLDKERLRERFFELGRLNVSEISDRERNMAAIIGNTPYRKAYVVAGAMHCANIAHALTEEIQPCICTDIDCWLIPYIPEHFKPFNFGFYNGIAAALDKEGDAFRQQAVNCLVKTAVRVTKDYPFEHVSLTDIINAVGHAHLLSLFRGKRRIGSEELKESSLSVIAKGDEDSIFYSCLMETLEKVEGGSVPAECETPLMQDYRKQLKYFNIKTETGVRTVMETLTNSSHRKKSVFFRRLKFLDVGFAELISGADYVSGQNKNLKREVWLIGKVKKAESELVKLSHLGATLAEVTENLLNKLSEETSISDSSLIAGCFLNAYFLEIDCEKTYSRLCESVYHVSDFGTAVSALDRICYLKNIKQVFDGFCDERLLRVANSYYYKALRLFDPAGGNDAETAAGSLAALYNLTQSHKYLDGELLNEVLYESAPTDPCVFGSVAALLVKISGEKEFVKIENYIVSECNAADFGYFLLGCSVTNRGILTNERLLDAAAAFVGGLSLEEFLECAPCLRYGFSRLKRSEKRQSADYIGKLYGNENIIPETDTDLIIRNEYLLRQLAIYKLKL